MLSPRKENRKPHLFFGQKTNWQPWLVHGTWRYYCSTEDIDEECPKSRLDCSYLPNFVEIFGKTPEQIIGICKSHFDFSLRGPWSINQITVWFFTTQSCTRTLIHQLRPLDKAWTAALYMNSSVKLMFTLLPYQITGVWNEFFWACY